MNTRLLQPVALIVLATCATLAVPSASAARREEEEALQLKVTDIEARLIRIEKILENQSLIQLATELEQLRNETKALRGELDKVRYDNQNNSSRQRELYVDVDKRLQSLEQAQRGAALAPPPVAPPAAVAGAAGAAPTQAAPPPAPARPVGTDQQNYQAAFDLMQARKYDEAGNAFTDFLTGFPQSPLADNAQYWLGEMYYVRGQYQTALAQFQKVIDSYPQSAKLPDALLKIGYSQAELGNRDAARTALQQVTRRYPDTTAARLATQRLERLQGGG
ncbi:MAG TPA: tol-pal system protein YbgF [Gammaproteobacteria bacterium]|nr:tol-pal system protein YbgF [Gammaproteobacteria bacterium]